MNNQSINRRLTKCTAWIFLPWFFPLPITVFGTDQCMFLNSENRKRKMLIIVLPFFQANVMHANRTATSGSHLVFPTVTPSTCGNYLLFSAWGWFWKFSSFFGSDIDFFPGLLSPRRDGSSSALVVAEKPAATRRKISLGHLVVFVRFLSFENEKLNCPDSPSSVWTIWEWKKSVGRFLSWLRLWWNQKCCGNLKKLTLHGQICPVPWQTDLLRCRILRLLQLDQWLIRGDTDATKYDLFNGTRLGMRSEPPA